jgi:hypothetical protein
METFAVSVASRRPEPPLGEFLADAELVTNAGERDGMDVGLLKPVVEEDSVGVSVRAGETDEDTLPGEVNVGFVGGEWVRRGVGESVSQTEEE